MGLLQMPGVGDHLHPHTSPLEPKHAGLIAHGAGLESLQFRRLGNCVTGQPAI